MNTLDILQYGNLTFMKTVQVVPLAEREVPGACGSWSVKDIIAHLTSFEILLTEVFSVLLNSTPTPTLDQWLGNPEAFNTQQVLLRRDKSAKEVLTEYVTTFERVMSFATLIQADTWQQPGILPWHGGQYSLDDFIVYQYYGHKREHSAEIVLFLTCITQSVRTG
jgi:hypothetical protein